MSSDDATVHVNRDGPGTISPAVETVETQGSFGVALDNHGGPAHVHCRLDGDLANVASTPQSNYFVEETEETIVPIEVRSVETRVEGTLEVSTRYGAEIATIDVTVTPGPDPVAVDESLSKPPKTATDPTVGERAIEAVTATTGIDAGTLGVVALAAVAFLLSVIAAAVVGGWTAFVGVLVVSAGVAVALVLLLR